VALKGDPCFYWCAQARALSNQIKAGGGVLQYLLVNQRESQIRFTGPENKGTKHGGGLVACAAAQNKRTKTKKKKKKKKEKKACSAQNGPGANSAT
jgi:hypothetical protein